MRAVLTYHSLDESGSPISTSPARFREQMEWLAGSSVRVVALEALVGEQDAGVTDDEAVALTFDDGFANVATHAAPLLRALGFPATMFVVSARVGADSRWSPGLDDGVPVMPLLDWRALDTLRGAGFTLGAHTRTHPRLPSVPDAALEGEIVGSADDVERELGIRPTTFAYPYGAIDERAARIAGDAYRVSCTTEYRTLEGDLDAARVPRLDSYYFRRPGALESWHSTGFRARLQLRGGLRRVRQLLT